MRTGPLFFAFLLAAAPLAAETSDTLALKTGTLFRDPFTNGAKSEGPPLVYVESGSFIMGSREDEPGFRSSEILHEVELAAYSIGQTEITNAQFCEFLNDKGNQLDHGIQWILTDRPKTCLIVEEGGKFRPVAGAENRPVVTASWNSARAYCQWLTEKTGKNYRLPSEAEWERASRAGTQTTWPWGDKFEPSRIRFRGSPGPEGTVAVGSTAPNAWGIHETCGNVWEWVLDCFEDDFYSRSPRTNPVMFNDDCWVPGIRGGSFRDGPEWCRPGYRINLWWWGEFDGVGFRVLRENGRNRFPKSPGPPKRIKPIASPAPG